jgi:hypothetical protein
MSTTSGSEDSRDLSGSARLAVTLFGIYLIVGAVFTGYTGKWFAGFPIQLDFARFLFGGGILGTYIEAALAAVLGLGCIIVAVVSARAHRSNARASR